MVALGKLGRALAKILCNQLKAVLSALRAILTAELAILSPIIQIEEVFLNNFVIFPLDTAANTLKSATKLQKSLNDIGIDKSCPDHTRLHNAIDKTVGKVVAAKRSLENTRDSCISFRDELRELLTDLQAAIDGIIDLLDIECPT
jgi:hypothetical protein